MRRRSLLFRRGWLLAALFQLLLPTFASVADARAEAESSRSGAASHVEQYGERGCPRVHPADCTLCRVLAMGAAPATPATVPAAVARDIALGIAHADLAAHSARRAGDPPARAPPC